MPERRRFNTAERVALYLAADGRCEACGEPLKPGWHADHVQPYSKNGPTDVSNGAALCPTCNLKKGNTIMSDPRTKWQNAAVDHFTRTTHDFLVTACPGAGKTRMALSAARQLLDARRIDQIIVVVPTNQLRGQWSKAAAPYGIDLTANHRNGDGHLPAEAQGAVVTYAQVAASPEYWRRIATRKATLVVFDEIHHAAETEQAKWGAAIKVAFELCTRRLLLSGTPFRSDGQPIPFVRYDDTGISVTDHGLSYGNAVRDNIVRPIRFEVMDGRAEWAEGFERSSSSLLDVSEKDRAIALSTVYRPDQPWISDVMRRADIELSRVREASMPDAGGLVLAPNTDLADQYARLMETICGERVAVVHSDLDKDNPGQIIDDFAAGSSRWLVAVDMVAEGVDIPRLAVGVWASRKTTEMWFRQVCGRFTRMRGDQDDVVGTVFLPGVTPLPDLAKVIEQESEAALAEQSEELERRSTTEAREFQLSIVEPLRASQAIHAESVLSGDVVTDAELAHALHMQQLVGSSLNKAHPADIARLMRLLGEQAPVATTTVTIPETRETGDQRRLVLRRQINKAVRVYVDRSGLDFAKVHGQLNKIDGRKLAAADTAGLEKRLQAITAWLEAL
jgi:superfamily II DNA or RNA helicase